MLFLNIKNHFRLNHKSLYGQLIQTFRMLISTEYAEVLYGQKRYKKRAVKNRPENYTSCLFAAAFSSAAFFAASEAFASSTLNSSFSLAI